MIWATGVKKYGAEITLNGMIYLLNFIKISTYWFKVIKGETETGRNDEIISLTFLFKECRSKSPCVKRPCHEDVIHTFLTASPEELSVL
jgi:hypothetical protein